MSYKDGIFYSPIERNVNEIPKTTLPEYFFNCLKTNKEKIKNKVWLENVETGENIKFNEIEKLSYKYASALSRLGFQKGDILYSVHYDVTHHYLIRIAVWLLGGITRSWSQVDTKDTYKQHIKQSRPKFILLDEETEPIFRDILIELEWKGKLLCFGNVPGAISVQYLLQVDRLGIPAKVNINCEKDPALWISTSGSTGNPKAIIHSHYSLISTVCQLKLQDNEKTVLPAMLNFSALSYSLIYETLCSGNTVYLMPKFNTEKYFEYLLKYKPDTLWFFAHAVTWFSRTSKLTEYNLGFIKRIVLTGAIIDHVNIKIIENILPNVSILPTYGTSENAFITSSFSQLQTKDSRVSAKIFITKNNEKYVGVGTLCDFLQAKIVDLDTGKVLGPGEKGEILVRGPTVMIMCLIQNDQPFPYEIPDEMYYNREWFETGDVGFFDTDGELYIVDRTSFMFKCKSYFVSPVEIETVLMSHKAVLDAAVVPIPNIELDNAAKAYIVLRPEFNESLATKIELQHFIEERLIDFKHLYGGIEFIKQLPLNKNGKLDRMALKIRAIKI